MKSIRFLVAAGLGAGALSALGGGENPAVPKVELPFVIYSECGAKEPYAPSGWMGTTESIELDVCSDNNPHSGESCIKFTFTLGAWGGVAWQDPPEDWGEMEGGYNIDGAKKLTFWARGEEGGEKATFGMGGLPASKPYPDSGTAKRENVRLRKDWKPYSISLSGKKLDCIKTGFSVTVEGEKDPVTVYIDDVQYE